MTCSFHSVSFFLVNMRLLSIYLTNLTIMGLFLPLLGTPILCVQSISSGEISKSISLFILFITTSWVSLFWFSFTPCMRIQFLLEYCSCLSTGMTVCQLFQAILKLSPVNYLSFHLFSFDRLRIVKSGRDKFNWVC